MSIGKILGSLVGVVGALWLGIVGIVAGVAWEHRPAGWPNLVLHVGPFSLPAIHFKDGPYAALGALQSAEKAAAVRSHLVVVRQAQASAQIDAHDAAAQTVIQTQTKTILKEIPIYVTPQIDARFALANAFVRVHDAAAGGLDVSAVPSAAGAADDSPSLVTPSHAAAVIALNYGDCRADAQQLSDLEDWARQMQAAQQSFGGPK
jgi:hypothetical protein